jgi:phospholipid transport system transporter-binding protein
VDSSGLTVVFGWVRAAKAQGRTVRISHPPQNLLSLAALYGVTELLPLA